MSIAEERMRILKMVEARQISAEEGARLLAALDRSSSSCPTPSTSPRMLHVRVTDLRTGKSKVSLNIPLDLVNVGIRMGARFAPEVQGVDMEQLARAIREGTQGKIIDVQDEEDAERVEIYVE